METALVVAVLLISAAAASWVSKDAKQNGLSERWTWAVLLVWPLVFVYLLRRPAQRGHAA
jgi:hypothetical protein